MSRIESRTGQGVRCVVIGLGYVGLRVASGASAAGVDVVGVDDSAEVVAELSSARSRTGSVRPGELQAMLAGGFTATTDVSAVADADVIVICVPTPLASDRTPDLAMLSRAATSIGKHLTPGSLVILESTTYPGTTADLLRPILEKESGLVAGQDFALAFSPERVDPGRRDYDIGNTPKVVGGYTRDCTERACRFYEVFVDRVVRAQGTKEAEMAKLLENTYRMVNIALVNEMAVHCHQLGIDFWGAIELARTKPFGFEPFYPGPGVGGHCIPVDPLYLAHHVQDSLGVTFKMVELAAQINEEMPVYVGHRVMQALRRERSELAGSTVLLLGTAYKPNVADSRGSPAVGVAEVLAGHDIRVLCHDPQVVDVVPGTVAVADPLAAARVADVTVLLQNHDEYDLTALRNASSTLLDTRGVVAGVERL
jgi:UDP-N-acetyl-D-glucosamine dehydrogenase